MSDATVLVRHGTLADLSPIKSLADAHRYELGFVLLPSLHKQIEGGEILIAEQAGALVGFVRLPPPARWTGDTLSHSRSTDRAPAGRGASATSRVGGGGRCVWC